MNLGKKSKKQFEQLLQKVKNDPNIIGFFLGGSRGKEGYSDEFSDYDPRMIVKDKVAKQYKNNYKNRNFEEIDLTVNSLSEFKKYAIWDSTEMWDKYNFTHIQVLVDKTGEIQKLVNGKGSVPKDKKKEFISGSLDAYINRVYRSVKCIKRSDTVGARLEAALSIPHLLDVLFVLHDRLQPFSSYLERELKKYPLKKSPWKVKELINIILKILATADLKTQQSVLKNIEKLFRKEGYGQIFDGWKGKDQWTMNYKPPKES